MMLLLSPICLLVCADDMVGVDTEAVCMEDKLRSLGILSNGGDLTSDFTLNYATFDFEAEMPPKKVCLIFYVVFFMLGTKLWVPPPKKKKKGERKKRKKKTVGPYT